MEPQTTNGSSKLNTILLIILILIGLFCSWKLVAKDKEVPDDQTAPIGQTQTNQNPNGPDYQPNNTVPVNYNLITKNEWGITFEKGANWNVSSNTSAKTVLSGTGGQDIITIDYVTGNSITDGDAKFGNITFSYDNTNQRWMVSEPDEANGGQVSPHPATPVMTIEGLPVFRGTGRWLTYVIPLSHTTFIKLNISGGGLTQPLTDLVRTIKKI